MIFLKTIITNDAKVAAVTAKAPYTPTQQFHSNFDLEPFFFHLLNTSLLLFFFWSFINRLLLVALVINFM